MQLRGQQKLREENLREFQKTDLILVSFSIQISSTVNVCHVTKWNQKNQSVMFSVTINSRPSPKKKIET